MRFGHGSSLYMLPLGKFLSLEVTVNFDDLRLPAGHVNHSASASPSLACTKAELVAVQPCSHLFVNQLQEHVLGQAGAMRSSTRMKPAGTTNAKNALKEIAAARSAKERRARDTKQRYCHAVPCTTGAHAPFPSMQVARGTSELCKCCQHLTVCAW